MSFFKKFLSSSKIFLYTILAFIVLNLITRIGLLIFNQDYTLLYPQFLIPILLMGLIFDIGVSFYWIIPFTLFTYLVPKNFSKIRKIIFALLFISAIISWVFIAASEFVFWNEFSSRFNFIAVDYLIYTSEVLGNIRQSYNLLPLITGIIIFSLVYFGIFWRKSKLYINEINHLNFWNKLSYFFIWVLLAITSYLIIPASLKEFNDNRQAVELAGNGQFEFGHAFFNNQIDYNQFYATITNPQKYLSHQSKPSNPLLHTVEIVNNRSSIIPPKTNIVLISVESLSADFMQTFGNTQNITPYLDKLAKQSLLFSNLYATGTRTVRGLEALSLSVPPTPGHSIVKRPQNENLFSMGFLMQNYGYESLYIYGGYSYFDNMQHFFSNNGYKVLDRSLLDKKDIHYENIWGVADEDLFTLSIRELDKRAKDNKPFFAHIMTTSNHRPYTYPEGRIDIKSKTGREGAVKYTDWAIGDFIEKAKKQSWFDNTIFVIVADHCASARGKTDLPIDKFHIPFMIYAPKYIKAQNINYIASQIDIAPTILGLFNISYNSKFFGQDILTEGESNQRAFMANYQTVGMYKDNKVIELRPQRVWRITDATTGAVIEQGKASNNSAKNEKEIPLLVKQAIANYQLASEGYKTKLMSK